MSDERLTARITGRVQGVGFRWWVRRHAEALGLVGWVMNGDDERSVEVVAEGPEPALARLERLLNAGPSGARVESLEAHRGPVSGEFDRFGIIRS
ncbi:MAG TPA: acylphosphatase [Candidatus Limnocylindrales bacterium]|nr:acylphosphatase [Candidatus Limnocylindrales bacterium]